MQVCTSLQTDNHISTPLLSFLQAGCPSCHPTNSVKALYFNQLIIISVLCFRLIDAIYFIANGSSCAYWVCFQFYFWFLYMVRAFSALILLVKYQDGHFWPERNTAPSCSNGGFLLTIGKPWPWKWVCVYMCFTWCILSFSQCLVYTALMMSVNPRLPVQLEIWKMC